MEAFLFIYLFILGLMLGSFYNVVGLRVPKNQSIVKPRSHCPNCQHTLTALELIPVFSFLIQKGKCKNCKLVISPIYPIIEFSTGFLFFISPLIIGWTSELFVAFTLISLLVIIFVSDMNYMIIPDKVLLFFGGLLILLRLFIPLDTWWDPFLGSIVGFVLLSFIGIISRGQMGGGDIKLFAVLGLALGWKMVILALFFSSFYGSIIGLIGMLFGKVKRKKPIPFGPFIVLGTLTIYFFGNELLNWYIDLII